MLYLQKVTNDDVCDMTMYNPTQMFPLRMRTIFRAACTLSAITLLLPHLSQK